MKGPRSLGESATEPGGLADSISQVVCGDCGAILSDWILDLDGTCLCFACADHWEPYHQGEDAVLA